MNDAAIDVSTRFVLDAWYVMGTVEELNAGPIVRRVLDIPMFAYRQDDGTPVVMLDRCPHRRFPMSRSTIERDGIRCGYHGLKFAHDGRCIDVPAQQGRCGELAIRTFEAVEHADWLWVWTGNTPSDGRLPPQAPEFEDGIPWRRRQICAHHVHARASLFQDNLLDLSHLTFLHAGNIGGSGVEVTRPDLKVMPFGLSVRREVLDPAMAKLPLGQAMGIDGTVVRVLEQQFYLPSLHITGSAFYEPDGNGKPGQSLGSFRVLHALTPETATTMHYFQAYQRNFALDDLETDVVIERVLNLPIPEDVQAAELIEAELQAAKSLEPEIHIISDVVALRGRALMQRAMERELRPTSTMADA
ncbi:Rieske 2Fe-2S domain-containing protein [Novosphingobium humi]|uniref:Rieske 2Fe-2S domain-containing protein n=1 Tax=Novosphingobium humi TaxID=2282397 RepID=A0ABY7U113_9SPHN|nr:Rieske 2Fe-2S domain-containing protein [Novosphingobium humi]WCT79219.1 Rieske 2Fe-2S domain-containing protein [Novosphingobium humi]